MKIDHASGVPLYRQIELLIKEEIENGRYGDGHLIPGEVEMAEQLGVSRNTVRQAKARLINQGVIKPTPGRGTVVASKAITTQLSEWQSFSREMRAKGVQVKEYLTKAGFEQAPRQASGALQVSAQTPLLKLERLRGDTETPFVHFISWFHPRSRLTGQEDFSRSLYTILENDHKVVPIYSQEELDAILPDARLADLLQIERSSPVLFRKRLVLDASERPLEYNLGYYRCDRFSYSIRFERK